MTAVEVSPAEADRIRRFLSVGHSYSVVAELTGRSTSTIGLLKRRGFRVLKRKKPRPRPSDFSLLADEMTIHQLARHYRAGTSVVRRWSAEIGRSCRAGRPPRLPIPQDFPAVFTRLGVNRSAEHYGRDVATIRRWRDEAGVWPKPRVPMSVFGWADRYFASGREARP